MLCLTFINQGLVKIFFNQGLIDLDQIFNHDRDEKFSIKVRLKIKNQSLVENFQSGFDDQKLNTCALLHNIHSRREWDRGTGFSIKVCLKFFNQGAIENKKSKSG
jgi:hypothetical protein